MTNFNDRMTQIRRQRALRQAKRGKEPTLFSGWFIAWLVFCGLVGLVVLVFGGWAVYTVVMAVAS